MNRGDLQAWAWCIAAVVGWGAFVVLLARPGYTWTETAGWVGGSYIAIFAISWFFAALGDFGATPVVIVERPPDGTHDE